MNQEKAIEAFAALAHASRVAVFRQLVREGPGGLPATEISRRLDIVPSTLSGHLAILKRAGLLTATRHQREIHYAAIPEAVNALVRFLLAECCGGRIENCAQVLDLLTPAPDAQGRGLKTTDRPVL